MLRFKREDGSEYPEWAYKQINTFAKCVAGATPSTKVPEYWDKPTIRWMSSGEVHKGEVFDTEKRISQKGYDSTSTRMIPTNTVVVALAGQGKTRGTVAITRVPLCTNQSICAIQTDDSIIDDYLYQYLKTQYVQLRQLSSGEGQRGGLNLKLIGGYQVPIPCLEEQRKIAEFLFSIDSVIADYISHVENMQNQKKGVMQQLFSQAVRFKADDGDEYPEWKTRKLSDICMITSGGTPSTNEPAYWNGDINWYSPNEIGKTKYVSESNRKITELGLKKSSARMLPKGTILLTTRATLGEMSIADTECCTNQGFHPLVVNEGNNVEFVYYMQPLIKQYCKKYASGSTFLEISPTQLGKMPIKVPCLEEQSKIANCLSAFDDVIEDLQKTVEHWKNIKKGLLQQLFA